MKIRWKQIEISITPLTLLILPLMYVIGYLGEYFIIFIAIFLHELAHMTVAVLCGKRVYSIKILPIGMNAIMEESACERRVRLLIYASGPAVNIFLFIVFSIISTYYLQKLDNMRFFVWMNIYLALFNLLPVIPLDGGRILNELLAERVGFLLAGRYMRRMTYVLSLFLILLGVLQSVENPHNFSLILIGYYIFFLVKNQEMEAVFMNVKDVIYRRTRLLKKGVYPAREMVALKHKRLGDVLKCMDFDRVHIIYVLDDELKIVRVLTEQEIMEGMLKHSVDLTLEDLMKIG